MNFQELAKAQRNFLIRNDKKTSLLIFREFQKLRNEMADYLLKNPSALRPDYLQEILDFLSQNLDILSFSAAAAVKTAQSGVIEFAAKSLKSFLPGLGDSIFQTDRAAIQKLIGRASSGQTLSRFFKRLNPFTAEMAKLELRSGFALGEPAAKIAARISDVSQIGLRRALTIARTETNEAYRAATRDFYEEAEIKEYIWISALSSRTCVICWHLHGRKFKTQVKAFSHPNCRCVLIPKLADQERIETGAERFEKLSIENQKIILGEKRFDLFKNGNSFDSFVRAEQSKEFGEKFFIKNLSEV